MISSITELGVFALKRMLMLFFLLSGIFLLLSSAQAQNLKIGFVNAAKILDQAPQAVAASSRLEREFAPRKKGLDDAYRGLRRLEERMTKDSATMSDAERRNLERDILAQQRELNRSQSEFREDLNLRRNEELGKLQRQVYETIVQLAKEQSFDLILNDGAVIYASDQVDITNEVLRRLK